MPDEELSASPISALEIFSVGIGPSSSHTVGPMRAARQFMEALPQAPQRVRCELYGSLALTGLGHATDVAVLLGLSGHSPATIDPDAMAGMVADIRQQGRLLSRTFDGTAIPFQERADLVFRLGEFLPAHSNGMRFTAWLEGVAEPVEHYFYSVGGGAIMSGDAVSLTPQVTMAGHNARLPFPFCSGEELLVLGDREGLSIATLMLRNEGVWRTEGETLAGLDRIIDVMDACVQRGLRQEGLLPGGLRVRRRARAIQLRLRQQGANAGPAQVFEWVSLFALAVNEENAAGGRVVTAPTNGAAGVIPATLLYYRKFVPGADREGERTLLLTAAAIGCLYKKRASISAAEMGCQGEVGVACSMAAAGLAAALGGTNQQVENAAEIGMEHNLGLTCDPIGGLVQIPCIERNTMGAVKAINAAYLALQGDGRHIVSLDAVIETMRQTGIDMASKYKETSLGGLAVNVVAC
ncbi:serine dehydratase [Croceibacterium mercuriale]|uniref:L-serine dehydratase n=1 Tax=Croceibacterium mercuriale TaxID=1572751 RepID=A0A0B2BVM0_9SPHN|nr:L-serine ammonia-lyase [Croceibacterium mercuriale]KHL25494.1 serine dehydratase [Croceibacterium mercuriale]